MLGFYITLTEKKYVEDCGTKGGTGVYRLFVARLLVLRRVKVALDMGPARAFSYAYHGVFS